MPARLDGPHAAAIFVGGAAGASLRWAVVTSAGATAFPWPVLSVNVVGSLVLGLLLGRPARSSSVPSTARAAAAAVGLSVGFCGGLTTFSTFAVEIVQLINDGRAVSAVSYGAASACGAVASVAFGRHVGRRLRSRGAAL